VRRRPAAAVRVRSRPRPARAAKPDPVFDDAYLRQFSRRIAEAEPVFRFGSWKWDLAADRVVWSNELHRIYGLEPGTFEGTSAGFVARLHPDDRERVWGEVSRTIETGEPFVFEERILRADGEERLLLSQGHAVSGPDGRTTALVGVCHDVTEQAATRRALGASERRVRAIVDNTPSIVTVKDLEGRYVMANAETGNVLGVAPGDVVGRACVEIFPADIAERQRANDRRAVAEGAPVYDEAVLERDGELRTFVTVTFVLPDDEGRPAETCTIATDVTERREREGERREREQWTSRILCALRDQRMVAYAQPVLDLRTGAPASQELLARMRTEPDDGVLEPAAFLPAAERFGLVQAIDAWMVEQALRLPAGAEVNLSAVTLCDPQARRRIVDALAAAPEAAARIVFEITETAAADHLEAARTFAADLTALGCGLALDDFGTGFGSFTYLRSLPLRYLKIDVSFVRDLVHVPDDGRVVRSIIGIAQEFGLQTIAEGVEDAATLELLREMGADFAQGHHLGRPEPRQVPAGAGA
jgi:PAS domain S-box-containing protein